MKKILQLVITIGFPIVSFALTDTIGGVTWYYTVSDGKARIGTGSSTYGNATSLGKNISGAISIPSQIGGYEVVGIGQNAFRSCTKLTSVVFPEGITSIGTSAFDSCSGLTEICLPVSLERIGDCAFYGCSIVSAAIKSGNIGRSAFAFCKDLAIVELSTGVNGIEGTAFYHCGKLTTVTLPSSVWSVGASAFEGCEGLAEVTIRNGVEYIGNGAFRGCTGLQSISLPATLVGFGADAVDGCENLLSVLVDEDNANFGTFDGVLYDKLSKQVLVCPKRIEGTIRIPNGLVTSIGAGAFKGCTRITLIEIPQGVSSIGSGAFSSCIGLAKVDIPLGVVSIEDSTFLSCTGLAEINIPESVKIIDARAFYGCSGLKTIRVPAGVEKIGANAFMGCLGLESITIPLGVVLDDNIFSGCNNLVSVGMSFDKRKADQVLYSSYKSLSHVVIPDGSTTVFTGAFKGCVELTDISIPRSVSYIGCDAFQGCTALGEGVVIVDGCVLCVNGECPEDVVLPLSVHVMADGVFRGQSLKSIVIPHEVTRIAESVFYGCVNLKQVTLPEHLSEIGDSAFRDCKSLNSIVIPASVKSISSTAFSGSGLKEIFFEGIPPAMSSLELPAGVRVRYNANEDFSKIILAQMGLDYMTPYVPEGVAKPEAVGAQSNIVCVVVSNVVTHYVHNSTQPEIVAPATYDTGFVNIIAEVKGGCVAIPAAWSVNYPKFTEKFGSDFTKALAMKTGKKDGAGNDMFVWQDYVAGTDPTDETDVFTASITIVDGKVNVSYSPELDDARKALRKYTTWGKAKLTDKDWLVVGEGEEGNFNFFKVTVEMR